MFTTSNRLSPKYIAAGAKWIQCHIIEQQTDISRQWKARQRNRGALCSAPHIVCTF